MFCSTRLTCMELHDCLWGVAAWVVNVWQLLVVIDCIVHLEMSILVRRKRGNVQTLELKQNIRLDEPKTEKNYSTQHTDAKGQIKRQTWLVETEGRVFKAEHANLQRQPWQCSFPPAQQVEMYTRLVVVEGDPVPTYTFITPSSDTRVLKPCIGGCG